MSTLTPTQMTKENTMNNEEQQNNNLTSTAPERIWLHPEKQGGIPFMEHDEFPKHDEDAYEYGNTYWSEDRNHRGSVPYIRADLAGQWKPIETAPKLRKVIVSYLNSLGKSRTVMACYYSPETLELHDDYEGYSEDGYCAEGWYEDHEHDAPLMRLEYEPTHWMPLPTAPQAEAEEGK